MRYQFDFTIPSQRDGYSRAFDLWMAYQDTQPQPNLGQKYREIADIIELGYTERSLAELIASAALRDSIYLASQPTCEEPR